MILNAPEGYISGLGATRGAGTLVLSQNDFKQWVAGTLGHYRNGGSSRGRVSEMRQHGISQQDADRVIAEAKSYWNREVKREIDKAILDWRKKPTSSKAYAKRRWGVKYAAKRVEEFRLKAKRAWSKIEAAKIAKAEEIFLSGGTMADAKKAIEKGTNQTTVKRWLDKAFARAKGKVQQAQAQQAAAADAVPSCGLWQKITKLFGAKPDCR